jgi:hypothetical protein
MILDYKIAPRRLLRSRLGAIAPILAGIVEMIESFDIKLRIYCYVTLPPGNDPINFQKTDAVKAAASEPTPNIKVTNYQIISNYGS